MWYIVLSGDNCQNIDCSPFLWCLPITYLVKMSRGLLRRENNPLRTTMNMNRSNGNQQNYQPYFGPCNADQSSF